METVSIVIVNWNRKNDVLRAIQSIYEQTYKNIEIIVVDNASTDGSQHEIKKKYPDVKLIEMPHSDFSACYTFNVGMKAAKGEIVAIMDNDATFEKDWVEKVVSTFRKHKDIGAITSKIVNHYKEHFYFKYDEWPDYKNDEEYDIYTFRGCGFAVRKEVLEKIGYYPEEFEIYVNEDDLAARIWNAGYRIRYFSDIVAHHYTSQVQRPSWRLVYYTTRNRIWVYLRYLSPLGAIIHILWALMIEGPPIVRAGQIKNLVKGLMHGFAELFRLDKKRKYTPWWEKIMWENEISGIKKRRINL